MFSVYYDVCAALTFNRNVRFNTYLTEYLIFR